MITIKIGGSVVGDLHPSIIGDIKKVAESEGVILVHGGGKEVTRVCGQMGKEAKFITSPTGVQSRYTDMETADILNMVLSGRINKTIVRMLQGGGINAVGLSGVDAGMIEASRKKRLMVVNDRGRKQMIDGGYTGKVTKVNADLIRLLMEHGMTPVVSPVGMGEEFEFLNVDGDRAAAAIAGGVGSDRILFVTNVDGLLSDGCLVPRLLLAEAKRIRFTVGPGMEKKLIAATEALDMGVKTALIANGRKENPVSAAIARDGCTVIERE